MKTKTLILSICLFIICLYAKAGDTIKQKETTIYTGIVNKVPDNFEYPLIGFLNIAEGKFDGLSLGFANFHRDNYSGAQFGFLNFNNKNSKGAQFGFINLDIEKTNGVQFGYLNLSGKAVEGAQFGFINATNDYCQGIQIGFLNFTGETTHGLQIGPVNITARNIKGTQIGFINYADSISDGLPIGFISIIRKNGYKSLDISSNETYSSNISFRLGVEKLYTIFSIGFNHKYKHKFGTGFGIGSILNINNKTFFNPELLTTNSVEKNGQIITNKLALQIGYKWNDFSIQAGPSCNWQYKEDGATDEKPLYSIFMHEINNKNRIYVGLQASLRYKF